MIHRQLRISKQVIALGIFICSQLTSCSCGKNNNDNIKSPETSNDTNNGGTNSGNSNNTGGSNSVNSNNTVATNSVNSNNTGGLNPGNSNAKNTPITPQRINELLQELDELQKLDDPINIERIETREIVIFFLKNPNHNFIGTDLKKILKNTIKYNKLEVGYNTIDILKLVIDKSKKVINEVHDHLTPLQLAALYNNTDAIDLLLQEGAQKNLKTIKFKLTQDGKVIPPESTPYEIAVIFGNNEAMEKLKP